MRFDLITDSMTINVLFAAQVHNIINPFYCFFDRQDINELWEMGDPMAALATVLANDGRGEPESRLLWAAGKDTMMACFHIGVYSDKELLGQGLPW